MYDTIRLEKGLYNLTGKSFTEALSDLDPQENYEGTDLSSLDAFERQLKRFDIKVNGINADKVEKFFETTESAVLFPEFVKRAIRAGMDSSPLGEIVAARTMTGGQDYRKLSVTTEENKPYSTVTSEGTVLPATTISLDSQFVTLNKFGRVIETTYEAIRGQRLDVFAVTLCSVGASLANAILSDAVATLKSGVTADSISGDSFTYDELVSFWGKFNDYNMTTIIASPATMAKILAFDQMKYACCDFMATGAVKTPFGAVLLKSSAVDDNTIVGIDKSCALEMINSTDVILEADKLIDRQIDRTAVSLTTGFSKIIKDATRVLSLQ